MIFVIDQYVSELSLSSELKSIGHFIVVCRTISNLKTQGKCQHNNNLRDFVDITKQLDNEIEELLSNYTSDNYSWAYTVFLHNLNCLRFKALHEVMDFNQI